MTITQDELKKLLTYNPETGEFSWNVKRRAQNPVGSKAGLNKSKGYNQIKISGKSYQAHRLAFLYITGENPQFEIDHIDGNKSNNKWSNLRHVSHSDNMKNYIKTNKTGYRGIRKRNNGHFQAYIMEEGKQKILGTYDKADEAQAAYLLKAKELHGEFFRNG